MNSDDKIETITRKELRLWLRTNKGRWWWKEGGVETGRDLTRVEKRPLFAEARNALAPSASEMKLDADKEG